ncbi:MAG TPA: chemotaxis protein CheW [Burkholderiales bacterium]|jgi:purine-binding chemotaxis protein CheW
MTDKTPTIGAPRAAEAEQYLTFRLDGLDYGIPIHQVQEIRGWTKVTPLPNSPRYIRGVLNLRGTIVPIIDLRLRFNLQEVPYDAVTVIVVINVGGRMAGIVVDAVSDVISLNPEERRSAPEFEGHASRQYVQGLTQVDDKLLVLIDVDKLVSHDTLAQAADAA